MTKLVLAAALIALATPAWTQTAAPTTAVPHKAEPATVSAATKTFVADAAMTDAFEMAAGHLAVKKAEGPAYLDFAQLMIADHTSTSEQLRKIVADLQGLPLPLPLGLDAAHTARIDQLGALSGADFEHAYKLDQVEGHHQAIARFESYAANGDNADLQSWAAQTLRRLKEHLARAEELPNPGPAPTTGSGSPNR